ncbi:MAG: ribonuclease P protein component [Acidiferrobacter sp.]
MATAAFPRTARLTAPHSYQQVFKQGRRGRDALLGVVVQANGLTAARLGLAVSRKVSTRAVVRNRIKRVAREVFRRRRAELPSVDIVMIAYPPAAAATNAALAQSLWELSVKLAKSCARS